MSSSTSSASSPDRGDRGVKELPRRNLEHLEHSEIQLYTSSHFSRFNTGRFDPLISYPITMTPRVRRLLDHDQFS